jgi:hypothetical protein
LNCNKLEKQRLERMQDEYVLTGKERYLTIRAFTDNQKRETYERQKGICPVCTKHYEIGGNKLIKERE